MTVAVEDKHHLKDFNKMNDKNAYQHKQVGIKDTYNVVVSLKEISKVKTKASKNSR